MEVCYRQHLALRPNPSAEPGHSLTRWVDCKSKSPSDLPLQFPVTPDCGVPEMAVEVRVRVEAHQQVASSREVQTHVADWHLRKDTSRRHMLEQGRGGRWVGWLVGLGGELSAVFSGKGFFISGSRISTHQARLPNCAQKKTSQ